MLGTFYISSCVPGPRCLYAVTGHMSLRVPNMILAFIPAEIRPNTLNTMTAFAVRHGVLRRAILTSSLMPRRRRAGSFQTCFCTSCRTRSWASRRVRACASSSWRRSAISSSGAFGAAVPPVAHAHHTASRLAIFIGFAAFFVSESWDHPGERVADVVWTGDGKVAARLGWRG